MGVRAMTRTKLKEEQNDNNDVSVVGITKSKRQFRQSGITKMPNSNSNKEKSLDFGQGFYFKNCLSSYRFLRIKRLFCRYDVYVNSLLLIKSTVHRDVNVVGGGK